MANVAYWANNDVVTVEIVVLNGSLHMTQFSPKRPTGCGKIARRKQNRSFNTREEFL